MIVCKFGGSSVSTFEKLSAIKDVVKANSDRQFIIVSAIGKSKTNNKKITDLLIGLANNRQNLQFRAKQLMAIKNIFLPIANFCGYQKEFLNEFNIFIQNLDRYDESYIVSRGEYFTAKIISNYLNYEFCDSINFVFFENGILNVEKSCVNFKKIFGNKKLVIPGFYGLDENNKIKLFDRGGGDFTASLVAQFCNADLYENYTDVNGILSADPSLFSKNKTVNFLSYVQCYNVANAGAKVFFKDAVIPVFKRSIPIKIINLKTKKFTTISSVKNDKFFSLNVSCNMISLSIKRMKNISKKRFLCEIIDVIMSNKIVVEDIFYNHNRLRIVFNTAYDFYKLKLNITIPYTIKKIGCVTIFTDATYKKILAQIKSKVPYLFLKRNRQKAQIKIYLKMRDVRKLQDLAN